MGEDDRVADVIRRYAARFARPGRFDPAPGQTTMTAVVTTGHGGLDRLEVRTVPRPEPAEGELLLRVLATSINNTDLNTRLGWYAANVTSGTAETAAAPESPRTPGGWAGATPFPMIQGVDCCGEVVALGPGADPGLLGRRVLVRPNMRPAGFGSLENVWLGVDFDGAFAQFLTAPVSEAFPVRTDLDDTELAALPCAAGTALNLVRRAGVAAGDRVIVTGASGGVGSIAVQLAARRGAHVVAVAGRAKSEAVRALGAETVVGRDADLVAELGARSCDVVLDTVAGPGFPALVELLGAGGRYAVCGAIAGPLVTLDTRDLYLRDLTMIGCTAWDEPVFPELVEAVERGELRPLVAAVLPLERIADAQAAFASKRHVGKVVLVPPAPRG
jgi:NADPH:quinone reductase-like Zn-dependent oxidoreductase